MSDCMMGQIPGPARERLLYLMRVLEQNGGKPITSAEVEAITGWASHTIRKDISFLGGDFGSSSGYQGETLILAIKKALDLERRRRFCVVGLGRLGSAYLNLPPEDFGEFELAAGFDSNVNRVEILKSRAPLYPAFKIAEIVGRFSIEMALLCVPVAAAQGAAEKLAAAGIRGILNFAPAALSLPPEVAVRNVYVVDELRSLTVHIHKSVCL